MSRTLVLLRHGQSQWNLENRFTGWVDVDLTPAGCDEARHAGALMRSEGLREVPVVDEDGRVLGLVDEADVAQVYLRATSGES